MIICLFSFENKGRIINMFNIYCGSIINMFNIYCGSVQSSLLRHLDQLNV